jgi:hypothetical protein
MVSLLFIIIFFIFIISSTPCNAGKGKRHFNRSKIQFDANANAVSFKQKLEEVFPKLYGGFQLLRRGASENYLYSCHSPTIQWLFCKLLARFVRSRTSFALHATVANEHRYIYRRHRCLTHFIICPTLRSKTKHWKQIDHAVMDMFLEYIDDILRIERKVLQ